MQALDTGALAANNIYLAEQRASEVQDVQESGVCEIPQSRNTRKSERL
jgi:hypothetical protein